MKRSLMDRWYQITNRADVAEVLIYNEVGTFGISASDFAKEIGDIDSREITLRINTPGGEVFDGIAIYHALRNHKARVTVRIEGLAASIGSVIAMAGDRILAERNAQMMIHEGHGICVGNAQDMLDCAKLLDRCSDNIADIYAQRAGGDVEAWRERMRAETWYSAHEAKQAGLVDEVLGDGKAPRNSWDLSIFTYAGRDQAPDPSSIQAMACPSHDTAVTEGTWDAGSQLRRMPSPMPVSMAKRMFGWIDAERVEDGMMPKDAGKLPHHEMGESGPGAANLAGVRNALARLPQSDIPESDQAAVRAHLRAHLDAQPAATIAAAAAADKTYAHHIGAMGFDAEVFRSAMAQSVQVDYDPAEFRTLMASLATQAPTPPQSQPQPVDLGPLPPPAVAPAEPNPFDVIRLAARAVASDAPAPSPTRPPPVDLGPLPVKPEPPPKEQPNPFDVIRSAVRYAANDAPAPPQVNKPDDPADEPGFLLDARAFIAALKEGISE